MIELLQDIELGKLVVRGELAVCECSRLEFIERWFSVTKPASKISTQTLVAVKYSDMCGTFGVATNDDIFDLKDFYGIFQCRSF